MSQHTTRMGLTALQPHWLTANGGACVIDLDNVVNDGPVNDANPPLGIRIGRLSVELAAQGVFQAREVFRNKPFSSAYERDWRVCGFKPRAALNNCDPLVTSAAVRLVDEGYRRLILVGGDKHYLDTVLMLKSWGVAVEVWSRQGKLSDDLRRVADAVTHIDHLVFEATRFRAAS